MYLLDQPYPSPDVALRQCIHIRAVTHCLLEAQEETFGESQDGEQSPCEGRAFCERAFERSHSRAKHEPGQRRQGTSVP